MYRRFHSILPFSFWQFLKTDIWPGTSANLLCLKQNLMRKSKIALARLNSLNTLIFMAFEKYAIRANGVCIFDGQINGIRIESCEFKNAPPSHFSRHGQFLHAISQSIWRNVFFTFSSRISNSIQCASLHYNFQCPTTTTRICILFHSNNILLINLNDACAQPFTIE